MFGKKKADALVVGAGPVGLLTALTLARRGVKVRIIDEAWRPAAHAYALALHPQALALLAELEVAGPILNEAYRVGGLALYAGAERKAQLKLGEGGEYPLVPVFRQSLLEDLLAKALAKHKVKVEWNHRMARMMPKADHVEVTINKLDKESSGYAVSHTGWVVQNSKDFEVPYVIGTDGHRSLVRRRLGVDFPEVGHAQHFAVFEFTTDYDLEHEMRIVLNESDSNVVWPLPDGRVRWSFELSNYDHPDDIRTKNRLTIELGMDKYPMLEESHLRELLAHRAPWFTGKIEEIKWRLVVRFERRLTDAFGKGRVWLAGDAGHMTSPVGVQSMNIGMREAHTLANLVADSLAGKAGATKALQAYDSDRLKEWRAHFGITGGATAGSDTPGWLVPYAGELSRALPASGEPLAALLAQVGVKA
ncbi:MAG: hypothetical protein CSA66_03135 [Proteobacteria bacterium]|nr:MAG: hypothetical protein CSA66_03135 [Pseudomonadota bacterium]